MRGFDVTVRIETFKKEMKDPEPGGRLKRLAMEMKVSVVGTTIPEAKLAFYGTGEAGIESEVAEARLAADTLSVGKEVIKDSIKQAVESGRPEAVDTQGRAGQRIPPQEKEVG